VQVFGGTVICRDLEVATTVARSSDVDCITLDGKLLVCPPIGLNVPFLQFASKSILTLHAICFLVFIGVLLYFLFQNKICIGINE